MCGVYFSSNNMQGAKIYATYFFVNERFSHSIIGELVKKRESRDVMNQK